MAKIRNTSGEALTVPGLSGFGGGRLVDVDEVVDVPDEMHDSYVYPGSAWTSVEAPEGSGTAPTPTPDPGGQQTPAPSGTPLYEHIGTDPFDPSAWPTANVVTDAGEPLYRFTGDSGTDATGASDTWHVYTGPTKPANEGDH